MMAYSHNIGAISAPMSISCEVIHYYMLKVK